MDRGKIAIIACESGKPFANKILHYLNQKEKIENKMLLTSSEERHFDNTEIKTEIGESIRGEDVYIVQDVENSITNLSVDQNLRALTTAIDAAHRSDANYVTAIIPVFPYGRQDKALSREGITAARVAQEIEDAGANRIITLDIHAEAIAGFFRKAKFENLRASKSLIPYIRDNIGLENLVISSADTGGASRANFYASRLKLPLNIIYKVKNYNKPEGEQVERVELLGNVEGKRVFVIDDMIDKATTARPVILKLREKGAIEVYFACSLALFNGPAIERLSKLYDDRLLNGVIGTDAVYHGGKEFLDKHIWYKEPTVADYHSDVIYNINQGFSISKLLD